MTFVLQEQIPGVVQRDKANGTSSYQHDHQIPEAVADAIYPSFESLSDETLLSRCLHGGTQNHNEAVNSPLSLGGHFGVRGE